jgi:hypothetical protein
MNETIVVVLIGAVVVALVAMPLLRGRGRPVPPSRVPGARAVDASDLPDEAAEIELDHAMGRLSDEDYEVLRRRVAEGQPRVESVPREAPVPAATAIPAGSADVDARAEALVARYRDRAQVACPSCGDRPEPGARFCSSCGQRLQACPHCGTPLPGGESRFCPGCGTALGA